MKKTYVNGEWYINFIIISLSYLYNKILEDLEKEKIVLLEINQYLPAKCQEYYFRSSFDFWVHKKDTVRAEKYSKILTENFMQNYKTKPGYIPGFIIIFLSVPILLIFRGETLRP